MRYIAKGDEPESFLKWKKKYSNIEWNDFSEPESQHREIYSELRKTLIDHQHKMCCYCEIALKNDFDAHIEHLKPKGDAKFQNLKFDFNNLLASCQPNYSCGQKKHNRFFDGMISPLDKNCQQRFTYTRMGKIIPFDESDKLAQQTIDLLGLNCKQLKDQRENIIKIIEDSDLDYVKKSLDNCIDWYCGFYSVIEYVISKKNV